MLDAFYWNWAKNALNDDVIFVASCVNETLTHKIVWPNNYEKEELEEQLPSFKGCIGFVDGTLVNIRCPYIDPNNLGFLLDFKRYIPSTTPSLLIIMVF